MYLGKLNLKPVYWLLGLILAVILLWALPKPWHAASLSTDPKVLHVLNRVSFGPRPGDIERVKSMGVDAYIKSQLSPESIPEPPQLRKQLNNLETLELNAVELWKGYAPPQGKKKQQLSQQERKQAQKRSQIPRQQGLEARLIKAIASPQQLQEVMVDFWFNHFNVFDNKGLNRIWVSSFEQDAIRPHAFGRFRDLLGATAHHPGMLFYLDNHQNTAPGSPGARGRYKGLNENYARELMELHTLGVDGGYTQEDVITLARILTGWTTDREGKYGDGKGFYFETKRHDYSDKVFLGKPIPGNGSLEGEQALDLLARHPSTAHYISYKLAQYFVADQPPAKLVDTLAQRFLKTDGDIRKVLETLFQSPEFWDTQYYNSKFKSPYHYIISAVRATGSKNPKWKTLSGIIRQLGMPIYGCPTPNGYKNTEKAWLSPDGMIRRVSFATALANGNFEQRQPKEKRKPVDAVQLRKTLANHFSDQTKEVIDTSPTKLRAALILGSPEMMYR